MNTQTLGVLTVSEFCQSVGISRSTWHKLKRQSKTPAIVSVGGIQRIRREAVEEWIAENEERATADSTHKGSEGPSPITV
jgi:excisionase family DNA binding protein